MKFLLFNVIVIGSLGYLYLVETGKDPSEALQNVRRAATEIVARNVGPAVAPAKPVQQAAKPAPTVPPTARTDADATGQNKPVAPPATGGKATADSMQPSSRLPSSEKTGGRNEPPASEPRPSVPAPLAPAPSDVVAAPVELASEAPLMKPIERQRQLDRLIGDMEGFFVDRLAK